MILERLLGTVSKSEFMEKHYLRTPFSRPGGATEFRDLATRATLETLLAQPGLDLLIAREGKLWDGPSGEARRLFLEGWTIVIRNAQRQEPGLADIAREFHTDFAAPVNVHFYATPARQHGFGWHYDAEDVFILQTQGAKEYSLRKNTVNPWPLVETIPPDMAFPREVMPMMKCRLVAGDWLYIPAGWWHRAEAEGESFSLAVGVMSTAAIEAYDHLRRSLVATLPWRQRLPVLGAAGTLSDEELLARTSEIFRELGKDLAIHMSDEAFVRSFIAACREAARTSSCDPA